LFFLGSSSRPFRWPSRVSRKREFPLAAQKPNLDSVFAIEAPNRQGLWRLQEHRPSPSTPPSSPRPPPYRRHLRYAPTALFVGAVGIRRVRWSTLQF